MARIRTIKPEFWTSEQVVECSPIARLLFVGMWNFCDDLGNHPASAKTLKMLVFPGDDFTVAQVEGYVAELVKNGLLIEYQANDGKTYWHVTGWHHQKIDRPQPAKYPNLTRFGEDSASVRRAFETDEDEERKGKELSSSSSANTKKESFENEPGKDVSPPVAPTPPLDFFAARIRDDDGQISAICRRAKIPDKPALLDYLEGFVGFKTFSNAPPHSDFDDFKVNFINWIPGERKKREAAARESERPKTINGHATRQHKSGGFGSEVIPPDRFKKSGIVRRGA